VYIYNNLWLKEGEKKSMPPLRGKNTKTSLNLPRNQEKTIEYGCISEYKDKKTLETHYYPKNRVLKTLI
jgi:hypothetical protein